MEVKLSVVVPSVKPWAHSRGAVEALVPQARAIGAEVILVTGHPHGLPESTSEPVVGLHVEGGDVFALRAAAAVAARGEIVAIIEDHCYAPPRWCEQLLAAWRSHPEADGLVGVVDNGAPGLLDRASFLLTWAPFLPPLGEVPLHRCPPPGVVSYRRRVLPRDLPPLGWLEYELPAELREQGRMVADDRVSILHTQHVGLRAFSLQYHAGRGYTGLHDHRAARAPRGERIASALGAAHKLHAQTREALTSKSIRETRSALAVVGAFAACNALGQIVSIFRGGPGGSLDHLE